MMMLTQPLAYRGHFTGGCGLCAPQGHSPAAPGHCSCCLLLLAAPLPCAVVAVCQLCCVAPVAVRRLPCMGTIWSAIAWPELLSSRSECSTRRQLADMLGCGLHSGFGPAWQEDMRHLRRCCCCCAYMVALYGTLLSPTVCRLQVCPSAACQAAVW
jgi:hypothetical protein